MIILGIDPGTSTAYVVIDSFTGEVLHAETIKREKEENAGDERTLVSKWGFICARRAMELAFKYKVERVGVEIFVPPSAHYGGKLQLIHPSNAILPSTVVGAVTTALKLHRIPFALIQPKGNGSRGNYPPALTGRRPKDLNGSSCGTRQHERSAYDVARGARFEEVQEWE